MVVVNTGNGSVTSSVANLTVLSQIPVINTQPPNQTNFVTGTVTFTVNAGGSAPLLYQWQVEVNGVYVNLNAGGQFSGVTNATLTINNLVATNATNYDVVVTNSFGSITSAPASLTVLNGAPYIITPPANQTNYVGQSASFSVTAGGLTPFSYQWAAGTTGSGGPYTNLSAGGQFSSVTNSTLTISSLVATNALDYVVIVSNSVGSVTSAPATLTMLSNPVVTYQKSDYGRQSGLLLAAQVETSGTVIHDIAGANNGTASGGRLDIRLVQAFCFRTGHQRYCHLFYSDRQRINLCSI